MSVSTAHEVVRTAILRVAPEADLEDLDPRQSLRSELDLDSLDFLAVMENVATLTGIAVPESDYLAVDSLDGFVEYLAQRMP
jgi:acyl carrier protein